MGKQFELTPLHKKRPSRILCYREERIPEQLQYVYFVRKCKVTSRRGTISISFELPGRSLTTSRFFRRTTQYLQRLVDVVMRCPLTFEAPIRIHPQTLADTRARTAVRCRSSKNSRVFALSSSPRIFLSAWLDAAEGREFAAFSSDESKLCAETIEATASLDAIAAGEALSSRSVSSPPNF